MPDNQWSKITDYIFLISSFVGFTALWYSPAIVSIATVLCGILFFYKWRFLKNTLNKHISYSTILILLLGVTDLSFHYDNPIVSAKALLLAGMLFVLFASLVTFERVRSVKTLIHYFIAVLIVVCVVNVISVAGYLADKAYLDQMLLQSKSIPIPNMHHIHFGIINGFCILGIIGVLVSFALDNKLQIVVYVLGIILLISFHILSSRTGLLAFYTGGITALLIYAYHRKQYKILLYGFLGLGITLFTAFQVSTSLQNKVSNSIEDMNSWGKGDEINHKSMAMRMEAYKMSAYLLFVNPFGVGSANQNEAMQNMYIEQETVLYEENRVGPHNQALEFGVKYGWIGVFSIVYFLIAWFSVLRGTNAFFYGIFALFLVSLQFESLLERQASIYFSMLFLALFFRLFRKKGQLNGGETDLSFTTWH